MKFPMILAHERGETHFSVQDIPEPEVAMGPPPNPEGKMGDFGAVTTMNAFSVPAWTEALAHTALQTYVVIVPSGEGEVVGRRAGRGRGTWWRWLRVVRDRSLDFLSPFGSLRNSDRPRECLAVENRLRPPSWERETRRWMMMRRYGWIHHVATPALTLALTLVPAAPALAQDDQETELAEKLAKAPAAPAQDDQEADLAKTLAKVPAAQAQVDQEAELAKQLSNPIANLISVPVQYNQDEYGGANDGAGVSRLIFQPVIPFSLNEEWNLITRTLIPVVDQQDFPLAAVNQSGLGDIAASQFFSPKSPTADGWIWGAGPVELLPTASDDMLGTGKWGIGPTAVALKQTGPWTVGFLGSHIWSIAGDGDRHDISVTSLQPFASYTTKTYTTIGAYTESVYDWRADQWSIPLIVQAGQMLKVGPQILQLSVAGKYWAESPDGGPEDWGLRVQLTFLFPK